MVLGQIVYVDLLWRDLNEGMIVKEEHPVRCRILPRGRSGQWDLMTMHHATDSTRAKGHDVELAPQCVTGAGNRYPCA